MPTAPPTRATERLVLVLSAGFAALEGYDLACYGVTVPSLLADPAVDADKASAGTVGSLVAIGMLVGAAICAATIRRAGSRRLLIGGAALFSLGMFVCAIAPGFALFGAARFGVGVGLGIVLPTVTAYVADLSAPGRRARNVGIMMSGYAAGALLAPLLGAALLTGGSWRWIYVIGAAPALVLLPLAIRLLPESPVHAADGPAPGPGRGELFGLRPLLAPGVRGATLLFWAMSFCGLLLVFGISTWLPTIMQTAGYSLGSSLLQTAAMWVGAGVGMVLGGKIADRVGIKPVVAVAFLAGAASLLVMSARPALGLLFLLMFVSGLGLIGSQVLTNAYIVGHHPPELRGRAIGWALSIGRLGAIAGPLLGAAILSSGLGVAWNFYLFAVPGVLGALLAAAVPAIRSRSTADPDTPRVTA
ncbi:MFS transporter [Actinomycetospora straminea]|uniref:Aromatic acid/H+ symport family MFS transporter n=1 Tax=Actinomycetospora straminea TaxID=663607 RepID=A0ABP9E4I3_9PSEU|nr:MFS transporter [Actinomycetospora straminea]MDD7931222.1 MFS transporter [Actinomycetospora straminea]